MTSSGEMSPATVSFCQNFPGLHLHRFPHRAMATLFEVICVHQDREYARQAAEAAFDLVDRLEQELSRFIENSDVARISRLVAGESTRVTEWTMECLRISQAAYAETFGAFDVSLGSGLNALELVPRECVVHARADGIGLDFGGIGKGYAVDRASELLRDWEINEALIHGGFSSVLALDAPSGCDGWPLTMSVPTGGTFAVIQAKGRVFSASGVRKGEHIIDPRTGQSARGRVAAWVSGETEVLADFCREPGNSGENDAPVAESAAAVAEAFSTAFMVLGTAQIEESCKRHPGLEVWILDEEAPNVIHLP